MLDKCENCGSTSVVSKTLDGKKFCSDECMTYFSHPHFCDKCISESTDEAPKYSYWYIANGGIATGFPSQVYRIFGSNFFYNVVKGVLDSWKPFVNRFNVPDVCDTCKSKIQRYWLIILLLPMVPLAKYRTKNRTPSDIICRKVPSDQYDYIYRIGYIVALVFAFHLISTVIKEGRYKHLEEVACPLVTQIIHEQLSPNAVGCKVVKINEYVGKNFYKATATLANGNGIKITIDDRGEEVYVAITPQ